MLISLALGGMVGTLARYGLGRWVHSWAGTAFPWGTLLINILGSFALGVLARVGESTTLSPEARGMLTVGFCGAFTTFSTFSYETVRLIQDGEAGKAMLYALGSVAVGIAATLAGLNVGRIILRAGG